MGFWITIAYIILTYLSPDSLVPSLAPYRPVLILGICGLLASAFTLVSGKSPLLRARQTYLMFGLILAVFVSEIAHLWLGGVLFAADVFFPSAILYFLVVINVNNWQRLRVIVVTVVVSAFILLGQSLWAYYHYNGFESAFVFQQPLYSGETFLGFVPRIRSVGALSDPNDFAQFLLVTVPLLGLLWRPGKLRRNLIVVVLTALVLFGTFLTHSRGGLVAFIILLLVLLRRRIGHISSAVITGGTFMAALALNFTGNRAISIDAGMDRLGIWSDGLALFKQSPLFGVGFGQFTATGAHTAHNSFLLCFSELGLFGFFFWTGLLVVTVLELNDYLKAARQEPHPAHAASSPQRLLNSRERPTNLASISHESSPSDCLASSARLDSAGFCRWAQALRLSFLAFIITGWFLSRTYVTTLYILIAMAVVLKSLADGQSGLRIRDQIGRNWLRITLIVMLCAICLIYLSVRARIFG
jgi:putative inorganic carbon (HCO3(-)) transporter